MIITRHGKQFFKLQTGDTVIALNPVSKKSKEKVSGFGSTIALSTTYHPDYNGFENATYGDKVPFEIDGPGDYEVQDIFIHGGLGSAQIGKDELINTMYKLRFDDIDVLFLGAQNTMEITDKVRESLGEADIVFVAVGDDFLPPAKAYKFARGFNPNIIIPMDYTADDVKKIIKEAGSEGTKPVDKLTLKKKDLVGKEAEIVVIEA